MVCMFPDFIVQEMLLALSSVDSMVDVEASTTFLTLCFFSSATKFFDIVVGLCVVAAKVFV